MTPLDTLADWVRDARARTLDLVADLSDAQLRTAKIAIVNPLDWEIGHVAYFQERFALRDVDGRPSLCARADELFDSIAIHHDVRWELPLPSRDGVRAYLEGVRDAVLERLARGGLDEAARYRHELAVLHEDMHDEAFTYTRQTMGYPPPAIDLPRGRGDDAGPLDGDVAAPGGAWLLGATPNDGFVFDNEREAHLQSVAPFAIARAAVTQAEFARFVDDGGYGRRELWSDDGWRWREQAQAEQPLYWRRDPAWQRRDFDRWVELEPHRPVLHVCWHEAQAYCRWARRRLPTELEWEVAAAAEPEGTTLSSRKRRYPWGDEPPSPERANLDWRAGGCLDVGALAPGESAFGCRQMLGNSWEWCADDFAPFPGFEPGPYREYSAPLFGSTKVLRGGCWATRSRLARCGYRNFYEPHRRDVWAGFRTCAAQ